MKRVTLHTQQILEGMNVAKDVFSNDGTLLIPQGTKLTPNLIIKINVYNIQHITIFVEDKDHGPISKDPSADFDEELGLTDALQEKDASVTSTKAFNDFTKRYNLQLTTIENLLNNIVQTGIVDLTPLYGIVDDVLNSTAKTSNLFSYMCRLKSLDDVTYSHSMNVSMLASILGKWLKMPLHTTSELALAGLLHDIGKVRVNQVILNKNSKLTTEEFEHIKQHTTLGYQLVAETDLPIGIKHGILMHHEKMNGGGYPLGLSWNRIHDYAKIISIVDIYDAMTAERPYHRRYHPFHVIKMFEEECYGVLDTQYLYVFLERIAHNFLNDSIRLSNGENAKIIFIHQRNPSRPIVQMDNGNIIDLLTLPDLTITDFL